MLELRGVSAGYGEITILRDINLAVNPGEIVALLGGNGVGKSTLNNTVSGLLKPSAGSIQFLQQDIHTLSADAIVGLGVVQVPEGRKIFPNLSVIENLEMGSFRRGKQNRHKNLATVLEWFPRLEERRRQLAGTLSGGEQQMLAIGRALMADPELLILDEPSLGLSPIMVEEMFLLIRRLHEQKLAILLVEQNVVQSLEIADRAYVLENGQLVKEGTAIELSQDDDLRRSYLGM